MCVSRAMRRHFEGLWQPKNQTITTALECFVYYELVVVIWGGKDAENHVWVVASVPQCKVVLMFGVPVVI